MVYEIIAQVLTGNGNASSDLLCTLLTSLANSAIITQEQMTLGFQRILAELPDLTLDCPHASTLFKEFVLACQSSKALSASFVAQEGQAAGGQCAVC